MSAFIPGWSSRAALALCAAALSFTTVACNSQDANVQGDKSASNGDNSTTTSSNKDAGKSVKPSTQEDASLSSGDGTSANGSSGGDAGAGDKSPSGGGSSSAGTTPFCAALAVIQDKCQSCHTTPLAGGAPMPLVTYADLTGPAVVSTGKKVYEVVQTRIHAGTMPAAAPLTADEMAPIDAWIAAGVPQGDDPTCSNQPSTPVSSGSNAPWPLPGCDATYKILAGNGTPVSVPAGQEIHPQYYYDAPWGDDQVQALGFRPITDNSKVLHHWILNGQGGTAAFISGWAPGQDATLRKELPADVGIYLPSGKQALRMDMHYNNLQGTQTEMDQSGVEICVTHDLRKNVATTFSGFIGIPFIPPGQELDIVGTCTVQATQPVFLMTQSPHAHKLCTHMKFEVKSGGQDNVLHDAPFTFDAQIATPLTPMVQLKNGDQVVTTCHYKNTTNQLVTFGENTGNEMCFNFASYYPMGALSCAGAAPIDIGKVFGGS